MTITSQIVAKNDNHNRNNKLIDTGRMKLQVMNGERIESNGFGGFGMNPYSSWYEYFKSFCVRNESNQQLIVFIGGHTAKIEWKKEKDRGMGMYAMTHLRMNPIDNNDTDTIRICNLKTGATETYPRVMLTHCKLLFVFCF